jgi:hypothetical protein
LFAYLFLSSSCSGSLALIRLYEVIKGLQAAYNQFFKSLVVRTMAKKVSFEVRQVESEGRKGHAENAELLT